MGNSQYWRATVGAPEYETVIVAINGTHITTGSFMPQIGWHWESTEGENYDECDALVTHWMPLPPPPPKE